MEKFIFNNLIDPTWKIQHLPKTKLGIVVLNLHYIKLKSKYDGTNHNIIFFFLRYWNLKIYYNNQHIHAKVPSFFQNKTTKLIPLSTLTRMLKMYIIDRQIKNENNIRLNILKNDT